MALQAFHKKHRRHRGKSGASAAKALDESCDVCDTAQLLLCIFVCRITKDFEITEELAAMWSMKGTTMGSDLFTEVHACLDKLGVKWDKLAGVTIDGCPNLTGKNVVFALYYASGGVV